MATLNVNINSTKAKVGAAEVKTALKGIQTEAVKTAAVVNKTSTGFGSSFKKMGASAMRFVKVMGTVALVAATIATIKVGAEFEKSMKVVYGVTRATAFEMKNLEDVARRMGATTEWTANQAADALKFLGMAGFSAGKAIQALPGTLDLATAGNIDLGRAADIATNALTAMQLPVHQLGRINDVFVGTITRTNTNMDMMAESFKYAAPSARAFGYSVEQLSSMIGILGNAGIQGSMAGTQLNFAFTRTKKVFDDLGVNGAGKDLIDALELANKAGWDANKFLAIFGQRGGRAALVMRQLIPEIRDLKEKLDAAKGEAKTLADTMRDTLIGDFQLLKSAATEVSIAMFKMFGPRMRDGLQHMTTWIQENKDMLMDFAKNMMTLAEGMAKVVGWTLKMASLRSVWNTMDEASGMAKNDQLGISIGEFQKKGFFERQAYLDKQKQVADKESNRFGGGDRLTADQGKRLEENRMERQAVADKAQLAVEAKAKSIAEQMTLDMQAHAEKEKLEKEALSALNALKSAAAEQWAEKERYYGTTAYERKLIDLQLEYEAYALVVEDKMRLNEMYQQDMMTLAAEEAERLKEINDRKLADAKSLADEQAAIEKKIADTKYAQAATVSNFFADRWSSAFMSVVDGSKTVGQAMQDMSTSVVMELTQMIIKALLFRAIMTAMQSNPYTAAFAGVMSATGSAMVEHQGGQVGAGGASRQVNPMIFANAQRFHGGLKNDEVPTILQKGEEVSSKEEVANGGSGLTIYNIVDPSLVQKAMASAEGQAAVVNVIRGNSGKVNRSLRQSS